MTEPTPEEEPKIIVDDDWKSQVEKEKEAIKQDSPNESAESEPTGELPPASFLVLMSTLASQALASMGMLPDPISGKPQVNLPLAKHFIDLLSMLQEKTKGNLTEEESAHLRDALHQLRMAFVSSSAPSTPSQPDKPSSIELP